MVPLQVDGGGQRAGVYHGGRQVADRRPDRAGALHRGARRQARGASVHDRSRGPSEAALRQSEANVAKDVAQLRQAEAALAQRHAEVTQALANLERDLAQMENARVQEQRYRALMERELIAREQYDQLRTNFAALQATVQASRAAVENARASARAAEAAVENARAAIKANEAMVDVAQLQLAYTTIRAPMDGRTGNLLAQAGNVLKSNEDNPLVVIAQVHPIYVSFSVPEQHLTAIKKYQAGGGLKVEAAIDGGQRRAAGAADLHQQHRGSDHRHHPAQGDLPQHRRRAVARAVRRRVADAHRRERGRGAGAGGAGGPAGTVRLRGEAGPDRRVAPREGGPATAARAGDRARASPPASAW